MSTVEKKILNVKINGEETTVPEETVVLEVCKQNDVEVSNLCYNRKLKPFAACRTCMVETVVDGKKELVYSFFSIDNSLNHAGPTGGKRF